MLAAGPRKRSIPEVPATPDVVAEDPLSGFCGAAVSCSSTVVTLEDRAGRRRLFPLEPGAFSGYCHRPAELRREVREVGLTVVEMQSVEGIAFALSDLEERLADPRGREVVLEAARVLGRVPELLGIGPHLLATARRAPPG